MNLSRLIPSLAALTVITMSAPIAGAGCNAGSYCNASTRASMTTLRAAVPMSTYSGYNAPGANIAVADHPASHYAYSAYQGASYSGASYSSVSSSGYANAQSFNPSTGTFSSDQRLAGLADDEYLCPATCPVTVSAPAGSRVIDCFQVCKKAPTYTTVTQAYQVVRPVIYVRYPVPVQLPAQSCPIIEYDAPSRYGSCGF